MPDPTPTTPAAETATTPPAPALPTQPTPAISEPLKQELQSAKGSLWSKLLIWIVGIIGVIGAVVGLVFLFKGKGPIKGSQEAIQKAKDQSAKADLEEKIKVAEAKGAEKAVIDKLKEIKEMDDEDKRLEELNKLL